VSGTRPGLAEPALLGGGQLGEVPYLRPHPGAALFARRAARLAALAPGHAAGDYLAFLGAVARGQQAAADGLEITPASPGASWPIDAAGLRDPAWRGALSTLLAWLAAGALPAPARLALARLGALAPAHLEQLADRVLSGRLPPADLPVAPVIGAALQVAFTLRAARLDAGRVARSPDETCPACGFPPVAAVVLGDDKLRYLTCGLCATQWHHTRVQCVRCRSAAQVGYLALQGVESPAKAETCDGCRAWLKVLYVERQPGLEPQADDLATLALDLLVAERGYQRMGTNLLLAVGPSGSTA
jgi:FdhE protein